MVVDEKRGMTRTTTVPASMLAQPRPWPQWVVDLSAVGGQLIDLMSLPMYAYEVALFSFLAMAWWQLHVAVKRRAPLE
jgi:hypothetical protein